MALLEFRSPSPTRPDQFTAIGWARPRQAAAVAVGANSWMGRGNTPFTATSNSLTGVEYREQCDQLGRDARNVPVLLPGRMRREIELDRVGLPPDHPWHDRAQIPDWPTAGVPV
jgi:hypothetical protein